MAVSFNSYFLYKKYEKRVNQPWLPVYPETLSIDGNGSMPKVLKTSGDPACYVEPQERWVDTGGYACEEITVDGKYKLILNDSSVISAECDSTSVISRSEISAYSTSVTSAVIGDNCVTSINDWAFADCSGLTSVNIPTGVTSIGKYAFSACYSLTDITIPNSVTIIGQSVFDSCSGLTSVKIGSGITGISEKAFYYCTGLRSITCLATTPPTLVNANAFDNTNNCPIYVPSGSVNTYKSASVWSSYASRIQAIP